MAGPLMGAMLNAFFDTSENELPYLLGKSAMSRYYVDTDKSLKATSETKRRQKWDIISYCYTAHGMGVGVGKGL
jgi:hypothetical protein